MPKIKTLRSARKRFKKIASGKFKFKHAYTRHILTKKSTKYKRYLRKKIILNKIHINKISKLLPYA